MTNKLRDRIIPTQPNLALASLKEGLSEQAINLIGYAEKSLTREELCCERITYTYGKIIYPLKMSGDVLFGFYALKNYPPGLAKELGLGEQPIAFMSFCGAEIFFEHNLSEGTKHRRLYHLIKQQLLNPFFEQIYQKRNNEKWGYFYHCNPGYDYECRLKGESDADYANINTMIQDLIKCRDVLNSKKLRGFLHKQVMPLIEEKRLKEKGVYALEKKIALGIKNARNNYLNQ